MHGQGGRKRIEKVEKRDMWSYYISHEYEQGAGCIWPQPDL